ncbi:hypothetical protein IB228_02215 [Pseudoxanthomonas sp. PXM04]|nr:hypothetical protein [Pseudoxanthomonas sp. PXM04]
MSIDEMNCTASRGGMAIVEGFATNTGPEALRFVSLQFRLRDKSGQHVGFAEGHLQVAPLAPGQRSPFKALGPSEPYERCNFESAIAGGKAIRVSAGTQ